MPRPVAEDPTRISVASSPQVEKALERFRKAPFGKGMPEPVARKLCEAMVAAAVDGGKPARGKAGRRSPF